MSKSDVTNFLKEQRKKTEEYNYRDVDKCSYREADKNNHRETEKGGYRETEKSSYRDSDKSGYRDAEKSGYRDADKSSYRESEKSSYRDSEKSSYRDSEKSSYRDSEKSSYRDTEKSSYRDSEKYRGSSYRSRDEPYEEPSNTIIIKGLPSYLTEDDIKVSLDDLRANYIAVRLTKDRKNSANKGIAFIEFIAVNDAKDVMEDSRGELNISGYYGRLTYGYNVKEEVDRYDAEKTNSWRLEKPSTTIMLRGVSSMLSDNEVRAYVADVSKHVVDVRLIRDKKTGMSRGFGFVEFDSVTEAQRWMEYQQGYFMIEDVEMKLTFTSTRQAGVQMSDYFTTDVGDWSCARCGGHNFKRRDFCYKCHLSKGQSKSVMETLDGKDQTGMSPCNTLILRDLDALTLEDAIVRALKDQFNSNVRECEIMRDDVNKVSRCFAFVELASLSESRRIVEYYEDNPDKVFELSGKAVTIDYAKNTFSTLMASYKEALAKRFEDTYEPPAHETSNYDANAAAAVAQAALNNKKMQKKGAVSSNVLPANVTVEGRASEHGMCFELIVNGQRCTSVPTNAFTMSSVGSSKFMTPDTSSFLYDQSTQYYFDPVTGLYYDANSQYFFDRMSQKYVYWDQTRSTYVPVESTAKPESAIDESKTPLKDGKKSKVMEAKKIAKEMERWEKMMNSKRDSSQSSRHSFATLQSQQTPQSEMRVAAAADSGFSMFADADYVAQPTEERGGFHAPEELVAAYNSDSDPEVVIVGTSSPPAASGARSPACLLKDEEEKLINWEKVACLLCNRGFKDRATLEKHRSVSDLHRTNLDQLRDKLGLSGADCRLSSSMGPSKMKYRDRAKERREKFGVPSPPSSSSSSSASKRKYEPEVEEFSVNIVAPAPVDADGDNRGARMMSKMGWQHGQGLGKLNQGRTELVQAEFVAPGAGIGAVPKFQGHPSDSYRENLKRAMYAKYHDA